MQHGSSERGEDAYEAPKLTELGTLATVTLADGNHFGKIAGGSDAFVMRGHGALSTTSA
jgi:hypothetical protein